MKATKPETREVLAEIFAPDLFDPVAALDEIIRHNANVERARAEFDVRKAAAKDARDYLDQLESELGQLIGRYEADRAKAERAKSEPFLAPADR